ncbi:hypothetical protein LZ31DRAFT_587767 [Colletotrichum somersetense]|nr:hypothetical protein LZ31DRAFT_587767 [Colletotrichum somersetense]
MASKCKEKPKEHKIMIRSRFGCRNCKLRKIKCDQGKPLCKKCTAFGVLCNFLLNVSDLQPIAADASRPLFAQGQIQADIRPPLTNAVWTCDASASYQLNAKCQDFITRYLGRSLITPGDRTMILVNRKLLELAFAHPYLMHASLAVAFTYDRYLNGHSNRRSTIEECFHWSQSTVLLNRRLMKPITAEDKDPIWGTAAALAILTFASHEACTTEQAWPLKSSESSEMDWLRMSNGKMSLWNTINPLRPNSLWSVFRATYAQMFSPLPRSGIDGIPKALAAVCNLRSSSTAENSSYFHAAHAVSRMIKLPDGEITTGHTQVFIQTIHGAFKELLQKRDAVALLLFYLWYRKAGRVVWWIDLRARVECPAIRLYLQLHHKEEKMIQGFLERGTFSNGKAE